MSYQVDSRNERVKIDYNQWVNDSPSSFTNTLDLSNTDGPVTGMTWPRGVEVKFGAVNYIAHTEIGPWIASSYTTSQPGGDTFASLTPNLTTTDYVTIDSFSGTVTVLTTGYYDVSATFAGTVNLGLVNTANICALFYQVPAQAPVTMATGCIVNFSNSPSINESKTTHCQAVKWLTAGTKVFASYYGDVNDGGIVLFLQVIKLR